MIKSWDDDAWDDYLYWQTQDKKTLNRKIDDCNRIVYRIKENRVEIIQCGTHYRDK